MANSKYSLEQFAYRKQAPTGAIMSTLVSVVVAVVSLRNASSVYIALPPAGISGQSLFGSLLPMAIMLTLMTTIMGVLVTVKKRIAGEVVPALDPNVRWFKFALATAVPRAFTAFGVVSMFGLIVHSGWPLATVSVQLALFVVGVVAAGLGYIQSAAASLKTRDFHS